MALNTRPWRGRSCCIVGSGLSLSSFDFRRLDGHLVIAINRAFEHTYPAIHMSVDPTYYAKLMTESYPEGPEYTQAVRERLRDYARGHKLFCCSVPSNGVPGFIERIPCRDNGWSDRWEDGVGRWGMSEFSALSMAYLLGADPIFLLGIDMKEGRFHSGYGRRTDPKGYATQVKRHESCGAPALKAAGVRVVNLNPDSALRCYEFGSYDDIAPQPFPLVISYHTPDAWYTSHAERLKASLRDFGLESDIECLPDAGSWKACACAKSSFVLRKMQEHPGRPLLWLDADATVERFPAELAGPTCDMAVHYRNGTELLSSTVYFGATPGAREIAARWAHNCRVYPDRKLGDQENLQDAADEERYRILRLPADYACIHDTMRHQSSDPVVLQWQASRTGRRRNRLNEPHQQHAPDKARRRG
jgi:hypothetical protein